MYLLINEEFAEGGKARFGSRSGLRCYRGNGCVGALCRRTCESDLSFNTGSKAGRCGPFETVWGNPHARLLITVTFIENVGSAAIAALTLYVSQYVVGAPAMALIILAYMVPSSLFVPI